MVHAVWAAHFFRVVERCRAVTVGDDEDVRWREDLQSGLECVGDESSRLVARDHKAGIGNIRLDLGLCGVVGRGRVLLEEDEQRSECVAGVC